MNNQIYCKDKHFLYFYDPDMFRGEFIGLNGSADFYADNVRIAPKLHEKGGEDVNL